MADTLLFFTEVLGLPVFDRRRRRIGRVRDVALVPLVNPARIDRYLVGGGWSWLSIRYDQVDSISLEGIYLSDEQLVPYHDDEYILRVQRDLLDQQIIDVNGRKVVRVNDVTLEIRTERSLPVLYVLEVDVGVRSIVRRVFQGVLPRKWIRSLQSPIAPNSIRWEFCNIVEPDPQRRLRLNISHQRLESLHPADLADIVEDLGRAEREAIFGTIDIEVAAEALSEVEPKLQARILESLEPEVAADILDEMSPDQAADVLSELEEETSEEILEEMEVSGESDVRELMEFREDTAGGLMNTEFIALPEGASVLDAVTALKGSEDLLETLNTIYLVDQDGKLCGAVPLARLFIASDGQKLRELAVETLIQVDVDEKRDRITELFDKYNLLTLPVTDEDDRLAGVITADDIISLLRHR
jgi:sporulation protein YlmC with PRC-barrel domain/CBS domain-containing protein